MSKTTLDPFVAITRVKIEKLKSGWFLLRSEFGKLAVSRKRDVLRSIADRQAWAVVRTWS